MRTLLILTSLHPFDAFRSLSDLSNPRQKSGSVFPFTDGRRDESTSNVITVADSLRFYVTSVSSFTFCRSHDAVHCVIIYSDNLHRSSSACVGRFSVPICIFLCFLMLRYRYCCLHRRYYRHHFRHRRYILHRRHISYRCRHDAVLCLRFSISQS